MDEFMNEIARDMRQERMKNLWRQYGIYAVAAVVAIVLFVAGRQGLVAYQENARNAAADAYHAAFASVGADAGESIGEAALQSLAAEGGEGYPMLARFQLAARAADKGDLATAEEIYLGLASDSSIGRPYRDAATVLSAMNAPDGTDPGILDNRLEGVVLGGGGWAMMAMEIQIGLALQSGDVARARGLVLTMRERFEIPADVNRRLQLIEAAIGA